MKIADIAKSGALTVLAVGAGTIVTFVTHMLISRELGVAGYGEYAVLIAWAMLLSLVASLGAEGTILKFVPGYLHEQRLRTARALILTNLAMQAIATGVLFAILLAAHGSGLRAFAWATGSQLGYVIILIAATVGGNTLVAALQAAHRPVTSQMIAQLVRPLLNLAGTAVVIWCAAGTGTAAEFVAVAAVANLCVWIGLSFVISRQYSSDGNEQAATRETAKWFNFSLSMLLGAIAQQALTQLPVLLVGNLSNSTEAGRFGVASRLASTVFLGLSAVSMVTVSSISRATHVGDRDQIQRILRGNAWMAFAYAATVSGGLWLLGPFILRLFGPGFGDAYPALLILMLGLIVASAIGSALALVAMNGRPLVIAICNLTAIVLIVAAAWVLVPTYGAVGGATASALGTVVGVGLVALFARYRLGFNSTILARASRKPSSLGDAR